MDLGYYYSIYNDFLGYIIGVQGTLMQRPDSRKHCKLIGMQPTHEYRNHAGIFCGLKLFFSYNFINYPEIIPWNKLIKTLRMIRIIPAFNTPSTNLILALAVDMPIRASTVKNWMLLDLISPIIKWIDAFNYEGSPQFSGYIPSYSLFDGQINNWLIQNQWIRRSNLRF